jgi:hypothetical protein
MKEHINNWLTEKMKAAGMLACGIRAPDRKTLTRSQSPQFTPVAIEHACRCLADTFQVLHSNRFPAGLIRWVYENYFVYGSIRPDGICIAIVTRREGPNLKPTDLEGIIAEFQGLQS